MLKKESTIVEFYESPKCDVTEIQSEGVLCASMEQLDEYEDEFVW